MQNIDVYVQTLMTTIVGHAPRLVTALLTLIAGLWIIRLLLKGINKAMGRANVEVSLHKFMLSLANVVLKAVLLISVAGMVGIETTSFIAILGAAGLAVGLALQGSLSNFAGGVLILLFRPFKVGDFLEAQGYSGTVSSIQIFTTVLKTPDNKTIIIPNGGLANGSMINYSTEPTRRVDMTFGIGYSDDIAKAKNVLRDLVTDDARILKDPEPAIFVSALADSSVNFAVRVWCNSADYWAIYRDMQEKVKLTFDAQGLSIPFPQRDVHLFQQR